MHKYSHFKYFLFFVVAIASTRSFAREITYYMKDFSHVAHKLISDGGQNGLYIIPLENVVDHLTTTFSIQRRFIKALNEHIIPGKTVIKAATHTIYHGYSAEKFDEPKMIFGRLHKGVPHTYAVLNDRLMFVESTGTPTHEKIKAGFSKHYIISGMQKTVRVSGEFFVYLDEENDDVHVVFDNASGTYQPTSDVLPRLKNVLEQNLADNGLYFHIKSYDQKVVPEDLFVAKYPLVTK